MKALMSIKPEFVDRIFSGEKRYEFRKRGFGKPVESVVVYSSSPERVVRGEFRISAIRHGTPKYIWRLCHRFAGIDRERFFEYFKGCDVAYAIEVGETLEFQIPKSLQADYACFPPQSYCYIEG